MQPVKDKIADISASVKSGMEQAKASLQEKNAAADAAAKDAKPAATEPHITDANSTGQHTVGYTGKAGLGGKHGGGFGTDGDNK